MKQEFKQQIIDLLDHHRIMTIATNRADGWPQATIVGYANDGLLVYFVIGRDGQKFANIARDPRVSVAIGNDYPQPLQIKGLSMAGRVAEVQDRREIERVAEIMFRRYPEYKAFPIPDPRVVPVMRLTPEIVSVLDYSQGFGHTDLVRVTEADVAEHVGSAQHEWANYRVA
jgi:nitroimidazol reductase NimA-like FMN-containing flavoprotein (pyridoxamine 5'-phosphate oxidase superfamily)